MYYKNSDYTIRTEIADGVKRYFIKFHGQNDSPEYEISLEIFKLYHKEFNKPLDNQRTEHRRHIENGDIEYFIMSGKLTVGAAEDEDRTVTRYAIEAALKTCTPIQKRRFELYFIKGYTFEEIARLESCTKRKVKESVDRALEKVKKYFFR
jgi:RNA polymerase sigma factor (sigma-70 family)